MTPDGRRLRVESKAASVVTPGMVREWLRRARRTKRGVEHVVVGDLIGEGARDVLRDAGWGWLDRRGHLRLVGEGVWIETEIGPIPRNAAGARAVGEAVRGSSGIAVAAAYLLWPNDPPGVRELARRVGLSGAAISVARRHLVDAGLIAASGRAAIPDLFWSLVAVWSPKWVELARLPEPDDDGALVVTGTRAAVTMGAPIVATGDFPPDLLAADERAFQRARFRGGEARTGQPAARLAVAPTLLAVDAEPVGTPEVEGMRTTHPLFVAVELAGDPARGVEALEAWTPEGFERVW